MVHGGDEAPVQQTFRLVTGPEYVQMELAALEAAEDGDPAAGGEGMGGGPD